jgi:hypothetical protein
VLREAVYEQDRRTLAIVAEVDRDVVELDALMFPVVEVGQRTRGGVRESQDGNAERAGELHARLDDVKSRCATWEIQALLFIHHYVVLLYAH